LVTNSYRYGKIKAILELRIQADGSVRSPEKAETQPGRITVAKAARGKHKHISHKHMSLSLFRRRENPPHEEIYKEHLKHRQASSNGASSQASDGTIIELDGQTPDDQPAHCTPNRRTKRPLGRVILPPPILGGGLGLWYWVYLSRLELTVDEQQ
jgi:hypothetical protein